MKLNECCVTGAFLTETCPMMIQCLYLLSLKLTLSAYQTEMFCIHKLDIFHFRKCFFTDVSAKKHFK
jgi:hypothetical protein